jgi:hypothetical protein
MRRAALAGILFAATSAFPMSAFAQLAEGQVWTFKNARSDEARIAIYKIEPIGSREAVHVTIYNLPKEGMFIGEISHMPFERKALEASLDHLTDERAPPTDKVEEGYRTWQAANGGIFTITVSEAIAYALSMMVRATPFVDRQRT